MMAYWYRKQEELKKLEENQDETNEDPSWADTKMLKRQFQGLKDIQFHPGKKF